MNVIVVLGQCLNLDGTVPTTLVTRIDAAKQLYMKVAPKSRPPCKVIVTGSDTVNAGRTEASVMAAMLSDVVPAEDIIREEVARTTLENAYYTGPILEQLEASAKLSVVYLVTSDFHLPRSLIAFRAVLPRFRPFIEGVATGSGCPYLPLDERVYGINGRVDGQRLAQELNTVQNRLQHQFDRHIMKGKVKVPVPRGAEVAEAAGVLKTLLDRVTFREAKLPKDLEKKWAPSLAGRAFAFAEAVHPGIDAAAFDCTITEPATPLSFEFLAQTTGKNVLVVAPGSDITQLLGQAPRVMKALLVSFKGVK